MIRFLGLLESNELDIKMPESEDINSLVRMRALLLRMAYSGRAGYKSYIESEKSLRDTKPLRMLRLTNRLMASIDIDKLKQRRPEKFWS